MELTAEEIRRRICMALGEDRDDWLDAALRAIDKARKPCGTRQLNVETVGKRMRVARVLLALSCGKVAKRLGVEERFYRHIEQGNAGLPIHLLAPLCIVLKVSQNWLLMLSDDGGPETPHVRLINGETGPERTRARWKANKLRMVHAGRKSPEMMEARRKAKERQESLAGLSSRSESG